MSRGDEFHNNLTGSGTRQRKHHLCCQCCHAPDTVRNKLAIEPNRSLELSIRSILIRYCKLLTLSSAYDTTEAYLSEIEKAWERKSSGQCIKLELQNHEVGFIVRKVLGANRTYAIWDGNWRVTPVRNIKATQAEGLNSEKCPMLSSDFQRYAWFSGDLCICKETGAENRTERKYILTHLFQSKRFSRGAGQREYASPPYMRPQTVL